MRKVELTWTWTLEEPLHIGSGLSDPGRADRLVLREGNRAVIPGEAVKGALRMSAEQIAEWLGHLQVYEASRAPGEAAGPVEPVSPVFRALFGGAGRHHYGRAISGSDATFMVVASTAIDSESGVAKNDTLRKVEIVAPGVSFECSVQLWVDGADSLLLQATTLLAAALAATESIGGKAGTGWGRVALSKPRVNGNPEKFLSVCSKELLGQLGPGLAPSPEPGREREKSEPSRPTGKSEWHRLEIQIQEPTTIGARPLVSNQINTRDHIPASVLRGAFREAWIRSGVDPGAYLSESTRWTPAFPVSDAGVLVPMPLSFLEPKDATLKSGGGAGALHDSLTGPSPDTDEKKNPLKWKSPESRRWLTPNERPEGVKGPGTERTMHVGLDYQTGAHRKGALYSKDAISSEKTATFVAFAFLPANATFPAELFIGKRTTGGSGRATLAKPAPGVSPAFPRRTCGSDDRVVYIQLLSPALLRGPSGHWLRAIPPDRWLREAKFEEKDIEAALDRGECVSKGSWVSIPSFMRPWGHGRAPVVGVEAGSAFKIACRTVRAAAALRQELRVLEDTGLGERTHEGFGWFVVDPAWLGRSKVLSDELTRAAGSAPRAGGQASEWPGCEDLSRQKLEQIMESARRVPGDASALQRPLRTLLRQTCATAATFRAVIEYSSRIRKNPGHWKGFGATEPFGRFLGGLESRYPEAPLTALRFALEVLVIEGGAER